MSTWVGLFTFVSVSTEHVTLSLCDVSHDVLSNEDKISDIDKNVTDVPVKPTWVLLSLDYSGAKFSCTGDEL